MARYVSSMASRPRCAARTVCQSCSTERVIRLETNVTNNNEVKRNRRVSRMEGLKQADGGPTSCRAFEMIGISTLRRFSASELQMAR